MTESTTVGAHAELALGFENAGASFDHTGRAGTWGMDLAQSRDHGTRGVAGIFSYAAGTRNVWLNAIVHAATPAYVTLGERASPDRMLSDRSLTVGIRPFRGSLTSAFSYSDGRSLLGVSDRTISWQQSLTLTRGLSVLVTAGTSASGGVSHRDFSVFLYRAASRVSSLPAVTASLATSGSAFALERTAPPGGGTGYDVTPLRLGTDARHRHLHGAIERRRRRGRLRLGARRRRRETSP